MKLSFTANNNINLYVKNHYCENTFKDFIAPTTVANDCFLHKKDTIEEALNCLENLTFSAEDIKKVKSYDANIIFRNGKEALKYAKDNNINIVFSDVDKDDIHAQWLNEKNSVVINKKYKNLTNKAEIYAISAAILHELSHAKDNDGISSIQEEIDCLAMNVLAFSAFRKQESKIFNNMNSPLLQDGVALYEKLFLGNDEQALIERIRTKYGNLPIETPNHKAEIFAHKIK